MPAVHGGEWDALGGGSCRVCGLCWTVSRSVRPWLKCQLVARGISSPFPSETELWTEHCSGSIGEGIQAVAKGTKSPFFCWVLMLRRWSGELLRAFQQRPLAPNQRGSAAWARGFLSIQEIHLLW